MPNETAIQFASASVSMHPSPIDPEWILDGKPVARNDLLSSSADGTANTFLWECTPGRFNWYYPIDETLYLIAGSVSIRDAQGKVTRVGPGDSVFFPAGSWAEWTVHEQVRKVAFCRKPLPRQLVRAKRVYRFFKNLLRGTGPEASEPTMFGGARSAAR
jgi:hypothetical protein